MAFQIIDRRQQGKQKSAVNRQRFLKRFRKHIKGAVADADAGMRIENGALEHSNVNVAMTLVNMIELARQYEMQVNLIKESEENADAAAQMMNLP